MYVGESRCWCFANGICTWSVLEYLLYEYYSSTYVLIVLVLGVLEYYSSTYSSTTRGYTCTTRVLQYTYVCTWCVALCAHSSPTHLLLHSEATKQALMLAGFMCVLPGLVDACAQA
jgi:hypothetical protein